jgi:hypothetical protein
LSVCRGTHKPKPLLLQGFLAWGGGEAAHSLLLLTCHPDAEGTRGQACLTGAKEIIIA